MIRCIAHLTDLSPEGAPAFEHALRLALINRCEFAVLHVMPPDGEVDRRKSPRVRQLLERWNYLEPGAGTEQVFQRTGVDVVKIEIRDDDVVHGLSTYLAEHRPDLLVAASHGGAGLGRMWNGSVSAKIAEVSRIPTLIFGPAANPFVDSETGSMEVIQKVLVAVDHDPDPRAALRSLDSLTEGLEIEFDFIHVGTDAPILRGGERMQRPVRTLSGPVVPTLLAEARSVSLLAMPMAGRKGLLDFLHGSTTEQVVREATCPVLALPVG